jgi:hypothetical protein
MSSSGVDEVNERSSWPTTIVFTDENGDPVVPASASYRIDDVGTGIEIVGDTAITSLASTVNIIWPPSSTSILDDTKPYETRRMTVEWTYGATSPPGQGTQEYLVNVVNLQMITTPSPA